MKKSLYLSFFFVSACGSSVPRFYPEGNELPAGYVSQNYFFEVEITNVILFKENIGVEISPPDAGLGWNPKVTTLKRGGKEREEEDYHYIIISGKPKKAGEISVHINGYSMGTMAPGSKIDKK